jgi:excisionase family DNA binding protein
VQDLPPLLKKAEAATFLRSHEQTVADLIRNGELVAVQRRPRQGSPLLISRDSLRAYLERNVR